MKTLSRNRNTGLLFALCLFLSVALLPWGSALAQANGRLIIRRAPDLGKNIIVQLTIDGHTAVPITYGHTYSTVLPTGRHLIEVAPSPNAKWKTKTPMTLNVLSGQTYTFTARNDNSGHLTLMNRS